MNLKEMSDEELIELSKQSANSEYLKIYQREYHAIFEELLIRYTSLVREREEVQNKDVDEDNRCIKCDSANRKELSEYLNRDIGRFFDGDYYGKQLFRFFNN